MGLGREVKARVEGAKAMKDLLYYLSQADSRNETKGEIKNGTTQRCLFQI